MNLNKVFVLGRLTNKPDAKSLPSGQLVVSFGLATNRYYNDKSGEKQEQVEFHNIVAFGKLAETISKYLDKGSLALFEGRLQTRNWQDNAGIKHYKTEILAERLQLGPRSTNMGNQNQQEYNQPKQENQEKEIEKEEIPIIEEKRPEEDKNDIDPKDIPL